MYTYDSYKMYLQDQFILNLIKKTNKYSLIKTENNWKRMDIKLVSKLHYGQLEICMKNYFYFIDPYKVEMKILKLKIKN